MDNAAKQHDGTMVKLLVDMGDRLGLFADLATRGAATLPELASRTGLDECYVGEWLRAMVGAGRLVNDAHTRMFALAAGMATPGGAAAPPRLSAQVS